MAGRHPPHPAAQTRPRRLARPRAYDTHWQRTLFDAGYAGVDWPREHGGLGASPTEQLIFLEETARVRAPYVGANFVGLLHAGPTLAVEGTDAQRARHLPRILRGDEIWCQGFSEPDAGSDLAALRTRAVRDGDHYVVNGRKLWTSHAEVADYCELLVRTDPAAPKHQGITWLILPMDTPGVTVRPLRTAHGSSEFGELVLEDVRIPAANRVGAEHDGWRVAMVTFSFERGTAFIGDVIESRNLLAETAALARTVPARDGGVLWDDPALRRDDHLRAASDDPAVIRKEWPRLAELGLFGLLVPEADGGLGLGLADAAVLVEELGRALVPGPLTATVLATALAPGAVRGAADGTVPVTAVDTRDPYPIIEHPGADTPVVLVDDDGLFLLPAPADAPHAAHPLDPLTPVAPLDPERARPESGTRIGRARDAANWRRTGALLTAALQVGVGQGALDLAVRYAGEREQFGRAIGSFQAVKHLLADALVKADLARAAVLVAAVTLDDPQTGDAEAAVAAAKLLADDAATGTGRTGARRHGLHLGGRGALVPETRLATGDGIRHHERTRTHPRRHPVTTWRTRDRGDDPGPLPDRSPDDRPRGALRDGGRLPGVSRTCPGPTAGVSKTAVWASVKRCRSAPRCLPVRAVDAGKGRWTHARRSSGASVDPDGPWEVTLSVLG